MAESTRIKQLIKTITLFSTNLLKPTLNKSPESSDQEIEWNIVEPLMKIPTRKRHLATVGRYTLFVRVIFHQPQPPHRTFCSVEGLVQQS